MDTSDIFENKRSSRLQKIDEQLARLRTMKTAAERRGKVKERKLETRRKILLGALLLQWMATDEAIKERVIKALEAFLTRAADRRVFGLAVAPETGNPSQATVEEDVAVPLEAEATSC